MIRINFLLALRNMRKYKFYTTINILGLAMSMLFGLLVFFYVQNAVNHDRFHDNHETLYRVIKERYNRDTNEFIDRNSTSSNQLAIDLKNNIPTIKRITPLISGSVYVAKGNETFSERLRLVDPDFFQMFSFPVMEGNQQKPLENKSQIVISPEMAIKYFGQSNPIGKEMEVTIGDEALKFLVSAVVDPVTELNSLPFELVIHMDHLEKMISDPSFLNTYDVSYLETFVQLDPETDIALQEELMTEMYAEKAQLTEDHDLMQIKLQPIATLYWRSNDFAEQGETENYNPDYVYILIGLSILVLIIAILNFIMLTSSQSLNRMKEFGIRKTLGALKRQLASQLLIEVFVLAFLASLIALLGSYYFIPIFNSLANATLQFHLSLGLLGFILFLITSIAVISSLLSSGLILKLKATNALKGEVTIKGGLVRNAMVVIQFTFCIGLIVGTMVFKNQMNYLGNKSLGFEKEELVEIDLPTNVDAEGARNIFDRYKNELASHPEVLSTTAVMTTMQYPWTEFGIEQEDESSLRINFNLVTSDYLKTMQLELVEGRDFNENDNGKAIIVNEAFVKKMGWESGLRHQIPGKNFRRSHEIVGVIKDFNFNSLKDEITPLALALETGYISEGVTGLSTYVWPPQYFTAVVRVSPGNASDRADVIRQAWNSTMGDLPFEMKYVNNILDDKYREEQRYSSIINYAAGFSLFIAWLGLLALTQLVIQKRFKEMGIRKVLGSTPLNIILLIARKFLLLIVLATVIASPVAWWFLQDWLNAFAYKINLSPWVFILSGAGIILITFISISVQAMKVSNMNPTRALRLE